MYRIAAALLPQRLMHRLGAADGAPDAGYQRWIDEVEPGLYAQTARRAAAIERPVRISIIVPTYNTPDRYLDPLLRSVLDQDYAHWELCIADGSDDEQAASRIASAAALDPRIRYRRLESNAGISGNTNRALEMATGEFVALLDHDDTLSVHAMAEVAIAVDATPDVDLIYSDEDKLSEDGATRSLPVFKPDWSPDMLLGGNYITHLTVIRRALVGELGGTSSAYDGAQDFDLVLRASEQARAIVHIPKVLYHWRLAEGSTAVTVASKSYAGDAGHRAVEDAVARRGLDAEVWAVPGRATFYRVHYRLPSEPALVSIIVAFHERDVRRLSRSVARILRDTDYRPYELVLVAMDPSGPATQQYRTAVSDAHHPIRFVDGDGADSAAVVGRAAATGSVLVFMEPDVEVQGVDWLRELVGVASQDGVGAVTPFVEYPSGQVQHAGVVLGLAGDVGHPWRWRGRESFTVFGTAEWPRNFLAVSRACLCIRADRYDAAASIARRQDDGAELGLALASLGLRNVYWPYVTLQGDDRHGPEGDVASGRLPSVDPFFNPNLDPASERIELRRRP